MTTATTTKPRARRAPAPKTRTLLVKRQDGTEFKVTVPEKARCTLSGFNPGKSVNSQQQYGGRNFNQDRTPGDNRPTLRIYEGTIQRAAFVDVAEFRDLGFAYEEKVVTTDEVVESIVDTLGNLSRKQKKEVMQKWVSDYELDDVPGGGSSVPALTR